MIKLWRSVGVSNARGITSHDKNRTIIIWTQTCFPIRVFHICELFVIRKLGACCFNCYANITDRFVTFVDSLSEKCLPIIKSFIHKIVFRNIDVVIIWVGSLFESHTFNFGIHFNDVCCSKVFCQLYANIGIEANKQERTNGTDTVIFGRLNLTNEIIIIAV